MHVWVQMRATESTWLPFSLTDKELNRHVKSHHTDISEQFLMNKMYFFAYFLLVQAETHQTGNYMYFAESH